jgi:hypothetical protein
MERIEMDALSRAYNYVQGAEIAIAECFIGATNDAGQIDYETVGKGLLSWHEDLQYRLSMARGLIADEVTKLVSYAQELPESRQIVLVGELKALIK